MHNWHVDPEAFEEAMAAAPSLRVRELPPTMIAVSFAADEDPAAAAAARAIISRLGRSITPEAQAYIDEFLAEQNHPGTPCLLMIDGAGDRITGNKRMALLARLQMPDDSIDVTVRRVHSGHPAAGWWTSGAQGLFAARNLPKGAIVALYCRDSHTRVVPEDHLVPAHESVLSDYEVGVRVGNQFLVLDCNPLVTAASRVNDFRGCAMKANCHFESFLVVGDDGAPARLVVALVASVDVFEGKELLVDYGEAYWAHRANNGWLHRLMAMVMAHM